MRETILLVLLTIMVSSCQPDHNEGEKTSEAIMPRDDIIRIFRDHLPPKASEKVDSASEGTEQFKLELSESEFTKLQFAFHNSLNEYARENHRYDLHRSQTTTFETGVSAFSHSLGKGDRYHYIITGSFVGTEDQGTVVVWMKPTQSR